MEISLDGHSIDLDCRDLNGALEAANLHLAPAGRIVVEVEADGLILTGEDLDQERSSGAAPARLVLQSADPRDLVNEALEQVRQGLLDARRLQVEAAESLQRDDLPPAMENIRGAVDRWQDLQRVVVQTGSLIEGDVGAIRVGETSVEESVAALAARLKQLSELLGAGDTVGLADELMYVWPDLCAQWDATLEAIIGVVNGDAPGDGSTTSQEASS